MKEALSLQSPENLIEKHRSQSQLDLMSIHRAHETLDAKEPKSPPARSETARQQIETLETRHSISQH